MFNSFKNIRKPALFLLIIFSVMLMGGFTESVLAESGYLTGNSGNGGISTGPALVAGDNDAGNNTPLIIKYDREDAGSVPIQSGKHIYTFSLFEGYQLKGYLGTDKDNMVRCIGEPLSGMDGSYTLTSEDGKNFSLTITNLSDTSSQITILTESTEKPLLFKDTEHFADGQEELMPRKYDITKGYTIPLINAKDGYAFKGWVTKYTDPSTGGQAEFYPSPLEDRAIQNITLPCRSNGYKLCFTDFNGGTDEIQLNSDNYEAVINSLCFEAQWEAVEKTLSFRTSGGAIPDGETLKTSDIEDITFTIKDSEKTLPVPEVVSGGYEFMGWKCRELTGSDDRIITSVSPQELDIWNDGKSSYTLEPVWEAKTFSVYFNAAGTDANHEGKDVTGSVDGQAEEQATATYGKKVSLPEATADGYRFAGWSDGTDTYTGSIDTKNIFNRKIV